jgi:LAO/AO transport system kinase
MSGLSGEGLDVLWQNIEAHLARGRASGQLEQKRRQQLLRWMWSMVEERVLQALRTSPEVVRIAHDLEASLLDGKLTPTLGARALLRAFGLED